MLQLMHWEKVTWLALSIFYTFITYALKYKTVALFYFKYLKQKIRKKENNLYVKMKEKINKIELLKKWIQKFQKEPFDCPGRS